MKHILSLIMLTFVSATLISTTASAFDDYNDSDDYSFDSDRGNRGDRNNRDGEWEVYDVERFSGRYAEEDCEDHQYDNYKCDERNFRCTRCEETRRGNGYKYKILKKIKDNRPKFAYVTPGVAVGTGHWNDYQIPGGWPKCANTTKNGNKTLNRICKDAGHGAYISHENAGAGRCARSSDNDTGWHRWSGPIAGRVKCAVN